MAVIARNLVRISSMRSGSHRLEANRQIAGASAQMFRSTLCER